MAWTRVAQQELDGKYAELRGKVLLHVGDNSQAVGLAPYADGVVLHGRQGYQAARDFSSGPAVLIDPERYSEDRGKQGWPELFPESPREAAAAQLAAGAHCLLAPSRFPLQRDEETLRTALDAGRKFIEAAEAVAPAAAAFVPIVVRYDELADRRWVRLLSDSELPIATIFAGHADPLSTASQLEGAIELVQQASVALVLRCDLSAAGLMTVGAVSGAIGVSSAMRHLWLPSSRGRNGPASRSLFVPSLANWMKAMFAEQAAADPDLDALFTCNCVVCGRDGDIRNLCASGVDSSLLDRHSAAAAVKLARETVFAADPEAAWRDTCRRAASGYSTLKELGISGPQRPGALTAWLEVLG